MNKKSINFFSKPPITHVNYKSFNILTKKARLNKSK